MRFECLCPLTYVMTFLYLSSRSRTLALPFSPRWIGVDLRGSRSQPGSSADDAHLPALSSVDELLRLSSGWWPNSTISCLRFCAALSSPCSHLYCGLSRLPCWPPPSATVSSEMKRKPGFGLHA